MKEKSFRDRLREIIKALGITEAEFAAAGNISRATLSGYFNSDRLPKQDSLSLWVIKYNIDANWLLTGKGNPFLDAKLDTSSVKSCKQDNALANYEKPDEPREFIDPIAERIKITTDMLERSGASPEVIQQAIMKILDGNNETRESHTDVMDAPTFANNAKRSIKRT